jgi:hypothetical protein
MLGQVMTMATRQSTLVDIGDICAPVGTGPWLIGVREHARVALLSAKSSRESTRRWVQALRDDNRFRKLTDRSGHPFLTWEAFCEEPPPYGFGMPAEELEVLVEAKPPAQQLAADEAVKPQPTLSEAMKGNQNARKREEEPAEEPGEKPAEVPAQGNAENSGSSTTTVSRKQERGAEYLVRRLKRDAPEVAEKLAKGQYPSARAAGIAAGIIKELTPLDKLKRAWAKASKREKDAFVDWIGKEGW